MYLQVIPFVFPLGFSLVLWGLQNLILWNMFGISFPLSICLYISLSIYPHHIFCSSVVYNLSEYSLVLNIQAWCFMGIWMILGDITVVVIWLTGLCWFHRALVVIFEDYEGDPHFIFSLFLDSWGNSTTLYPMSISHLHHVIPSSVQ